jgi:hypothetical protein
MASDIAKYVRRTTIASLVLAACLFAGIPVASQALDNDGLPITVEVLTPTTAPSPRAEVPVVIPVDVPIAEAVFPIVVTGLAPNSYVEIYANSTPVLIASGFADANGRFEVSVRLPPNLSVGEHSISVTNTLANGTKVSSTIVAFAVSVTGKIAPSATAAGSGSSTSTRSDSSVPSSGEVAEETVTGSAEALLLGPDPFNLGGVLYLGGLTSHAVYPDGAFTPASEMTFAVRNVSSTNVTAQVAFSVSNSLGMTVATAPRFTMRNLAPGETRTVTAVVRNIGQWGAYSAHMKITPPETVSDNTLTPFERSDDFFAFAGWVFLSLFFVVTLLVSYALGRRFRAWSTPVEYLRSLGTRLPFGREVDGAVQ